MDIDNFGTNISGLTFTLPMRANADYSLSILTKQKCYLLKGGISTKRWHYLLPGGAVQLQHLAFYL